MNRIDGWEKVAPSYGVIPQSLPVGKYKLTVVGASEYHNPQSSKTSLKIAFDIAEGRYSGFYRERFNAFKRAKGADAKWPNDGIFYLSLDPQYISRIKGFIHCVEKSNSGFSWAWDEKALIGKIFAGRITEEKSTNNGKEYTNSKLTAFYPLDEWDSIPDVKAKLKEEKADTPFGSATVSNNGPQWGNAFNPDDVPF